MRTNDSSSENIGRYGDLFNCISSGVAVYEAIENGNDFIIRDINRSGEKIDQVKKEEIVGKRVEEVFSGIRNFGLFDVFRRVWKTGKSERYPIALYMDERVSHLVENYVYRLPSGEIVAVYDDVTEQKKSEEALKEREELLESVLVAAPIGIGMVVNRILKFVNQKFCEMVGFQREELIGNSTRILYETDEEFNRVGKYHYERIEITGTDNIETRFRRKDGEIIDVMLSSAAVKSLKRLSGIIFTATDITQRKRGEHALRQSEQRNRKLIEALPEAVLVFTGDGQVANCNGVACRLLGYSREEIGDKRLIDLIPADVAGKISTAMTGIKPKQTITLEAVVVRKNSETFPAILKMKTVTIDREEQLLICLHDSSQPET